MRTIAVVTVARSDYGIYYPILKLLSAEPGIRLRLLVGGMHLSPEFGNTVKEIESGPFAIDERIEMLLSSETPDGIAKSMALGMIGFSQAFQRDRPDILLVLGDRFEMHSAVVAALPFAIPVAHIHGGELTLGAVDDALRHSITKLSHLHFASTEDHARRIRQMGEASGRVFVSGAPGLDNLAGIKFASRDEIQQRHQISLRNPFLLVTFHPCTLELENTRTAAVELLAALDQSPVRPVFTYPNADASSRIVIDLINQYAAGGRAQVVASLGTSDYFSLMNMAEAMVGNSSSGIIEAASFRLPVVNTGNRQKGRTRARNVIDVGGERNEIAKGIEKALSPEFRATLADLVNPYGDGQAAGRIVRVLREVPLGPELIQKQFCDV